MSNTLDSGLIASKASARALTILTSLLAPLRAFSSDFSDEFRDIDSGGTVNVPLATAGSTTLTNPTNFEAGDSTLGKVPVTLAHYSQPFHITARQLEQGYKLANLMDINLRAFANKLLDVAMAPVTTTNFGAAVVTDTADFFGVDGGSQTLFAALKDGTTRALVIDGAIYAQTLPTNRNSFALGEQGAFGWDGGIHMNNRWTGAGAGVTGFAASPEALAVAAVIPEMAEPIQSLMHTQELIALPDLGLTIQFNSWGSLATRNLWGSFDVAFGAAKGDGNALKLIIPA